MADESLKMLFIQVLFSTHISQAHLMNGTWPRQSKVYSTPHPPQSGGAVDSANEAFGDSKVFLLIKIEKEKAG